MLSLIKKSGDHLRDAKETYWQHFSFASRFGLQLIGAGFAVLIHSVLPGLFQRTGSGTVNRLHENLKTRTHCHEKSR